MRGFHQRLRGFTVDAWQADVQPGSEQVATVVRAEVDFGIDGSIRGQRDLFLTSDHSQRTEEASRPPSGEELFRICPVARCAGAREFHVDTAIRTSCRAISTTRCVRL